MPSSYVGKFFHHQEEFKNRLIFIKQVIINKLNWQTIHGNK